MVSSPLSILIFCTGCSSHCCDKIPRWTVTSNWEAKSFFLYVASVGVFDHSEYTLKADHLGSNPVSTTPISCRCLEDQNR